MVEGKTEKFTVVRGGVAVGVAVGDDPAVAVGVGSLVPVGEEVGTGLEPVDVGVLKGVVVVLGKGVGVGPVFCWLRTFERVVAA